MHQHRGAGPLVAMAISPLHQRHQYGREVSARFGQTVLIALRTILIGHLLEYAMVNQTPQARGQQVRRNAEVISQIAEAMDATKDSSQDKQ